MRGIEALLLAGFVGLIGLGVWNARQWFPQWSGATSISAAPAAGKVTAELSKKSGAKVRNVAFKRRNGREAESDSAFPISKTEVQIPAWHPAFPTAADLHVGASGTQIVTKYGEPNARITEMRTGHLLEHYYYFNGDRTRLTVAKLEGGVLVSAESLSR